MIKKLHNQYFPTPSYLMMESLAVDISDQSIKYGKLYISSFGLRLGNFGKERIPEGVIVSGIIENQNKLVEILKNIKEKNNTNFVRVSLPEEQMYLFVLSLPRIEDMNIREMILLQIEEHIPLKAIDTIFEFDVILTSDTNVLVEVFAIASSTIDSYLSVFSKANMIPISFELEAQAIARAVIPYENNESIMIVDFGDTRTGVSIVHDRKVFFTTTIDIGGVNLTSMISKNFSLSMEKAEEMKRSYGLDGNSSIEDIFPVILNGISVLRDELSKQYQYWKDHDNVGISHNKISRIILCGGDANLVGLSDYLEASMKIKVEHANAWVNISDMKKSIPNMSFEESLGYTTVLGLALGCLSPYEDSVVSVLPYREKSLIKKEYWKRFIIIVLNIFSLAILIFILSLLPSYFYSLSKEKISEEKLETFNAFNKDLSDLNLDKKIKVINNNLNLLNINKPLYNVYDEILNIILTDKTEGITINQIFFNSRKAKDKETLSLEIHGISRDRVTLRKFKSTLDINPKVYTSDLPINNYLEKDNLNFVLKIILK